MIDILATEQTFHALSVKDLLEARDLYHNHLLHKANVVGTAIGLYLMRDREGRPAPGREASQRAALGPRRLDNSSVHENSWPCILVLVKRWVDEHQFGVAQDKLHPHDMVPSRLYLPDGRVVPVCVVEVTPGEANPPPVLPDWHWPEGLIGGGCPILVETQGQRHVASAGCLVTDGHTLYALTNRHVCGARGENVLSILRGRDVVIGWASDKQITRSPFASIYPAYQGRQTYLNLDVGLVRVLNASDWTSQVYGIGPIGELADLSEQNITLRLIGAPVIAHGAASGRIKGQIKALFYRYKAVGGYEYVSDFLIAPDLESGGQTREGDSGTIWLLEPDKDHPLPRPIAIEWGGQVFLEGAADRRLNFALATNLSNVCKLLDVELVQAHNTGVQPFWGQTGHYSIATFACDAISSPKLRALMKANLTNISFTTEGLDPAAIKAALKAAKENGDIVPLADVPDIVWKQMPNKMKGGRDERFVPPAASTGPEHPTHYADIDEPRPSDGKTLRQLCLDDQANIDVDVWRAFYDETGHAQQRSRGLLPFRIWQFYDAMVDFARAKDVAGFVCAAGVVSHYVGDACQPLHGSMFSDGFADQPTTVEHHHRHGPPTEDPSHVGAGVHSAYETSMIDRKEPELLEAIRGKLDANPSPPAVATGKAAADAVIRMMERTAQRIPPRDLVNAFVQAGGTNTVAVLNALWDQFGDDTAEVMVDGARMLAMIWDSAWNAGNGNTIAQNKLGAVDPQELMNRYQDKSFVPSLDLDTIGPVLR
jgi:hypothetical protein